MEGNLEAEHPREKAKQKPDIFGVGAWLDAHHDPLASLYTFCTCVGENMSIMCVYIYNTRFILPFYFKKALEDLDGDGDFKVQLVVGEPLAILFIIVCVSLLYFVCIY